MLARKIRIRKLTPMGHETLMADPEDVLPIIEEALMQRRFVFCEPMRVMVRNLNEASQLINDLQEVVIMPPVAGGCPIHFLSKGFILLVIVERDWKTCCSSRFACEAFGSCS